MGLDTSSNISLWKDKALIEANVAVLYSFQVRIASINQNRIYNAPFPKDTKRQVFLLQGEWDEVFEIMISNPY